MDDAGTPERLQALRCALIDPAICEFGGELVQTDGDSLIAFNSIDGVRCAVKVHLSRISGMFVISRNTAFTYRSKPTETKQIGRELGVRYVLEGSVRRSDYQLRVNAHLIDAATDAHLWTERFDHDTGDLFALENEITSCLANALGVELIAAEAARPAEHPDTLDYILRGRAAGLKPYSRENLAEQISLFEHALALDPKSVEAQIL